MKFEVLTLFPEIIEAYAGVSVLGRGIEAGAIEVSAVNIRDFAHDKHKTVDDTPYGGGAGMVLKVEPIARALESVGAVKNAPDTRIVVMGAKGEEFTQEKAREYAGLERLVLICGRYEGVDQRVIDYLADEEVSVGPYVLAGGELPALTIIEAAARLVPGVLGNEASVVTESHSKPGVKEAPQYTKPEEFNGWKVPEVLLSGNHATIEAWREEQSKM